MSDNNSRPVHNDFINCSLNFLLTLLVQGRSSFVEQKKRRLAAKRSSYRNPLLLASSKAGALVSTRDFELLRQFTFVKVFFLHLKDKIVGVGVLSSLDNILRSSSRVPVADVVSNILIK